MRVTLGLAVMAMSVGAQPAWSQQQAVHRAGAPLTLLVAGPIVPGQGVAITPNVSLRVTTPPPLISRDPLVYSDGRFQERVDSSMIDFFPLGEGLHLSAGMRLFARQNADRTYRGLVYSPRGRGLGGIGGRRFTPAATIGYMRPVGPGTVLGFEAGAVMGRLNSGMSGRLRQADADGNGMTGLKPVTGINRIAHLTFGYRF
jgi:hypothetical protein